MNLLHFWSKVILIIGISGAGISCSFAQIIYSSDHYESSAAPSDYPGGTLTSPNGARSSDLAYHDQELSAPEMNIEYTTPYHSFPFEESVNGVQNHTNEAENMGTDDRYYDHWVQYDVQDWQLQVLPSGLIYPSYLAGRKEPRLQSIATYDDGYGWIWDITLGGRVPLLRYGTTDAVNPEGWQIDMEGAALLRLDFERHRNLAATDYRAGAPITYGTGKWQYKFAYYHVSSHLGDCYLLDDFRKKIHYVRDELVLGIAYRPIPAVRLYGEAGWAFNAGETTKPWEFQFGAEYSQPYHPDNKKGSPFAAVHAHLFEESDFGGYLNTQLGWQWRSATNALLRVGGEFYCGRDDEFQFHDTHQKKIGLGFWYDF